MKWHTLRQKMKTFIFTIFLAATATDKSFAKALKNALADRIFDRLIGYVNSRKFRRKIGNKESKVKTK